MFESLADRLQQALGEVRSRGRLSEEDVERALRQVRLALLEADVDFRVVKEFTARVRERAIGTQVLASVNPAHQVVKVVADELTELLGGTTSEFVLPKARPAVVVLAGLQGSGKTTAAAKLARYLRAERGLDVALAACDLQRPAAVEQLVLLGGRADCTVYERGTDATPVEVAGWALGRAREEQRDVLIVDTAGRLHVDDQLMAELQAITERVRPHRVLLVLDAMTGQDAVNVATAFAERAPFDGLVLTKLDGDARGGAALSVKAVTGRPIVFASTGERLEEFELFHPDRVAQRILGMGDVVTLVERAQRELDERKAAELERKMRRAELTLEDFLEQLRQIRKMGPLKSLLGMLPGMGSQLAALDLDERELDRVEAIILSMTPEERRRPEIIDASRRRRIARGSGTSPQQVAQLVKQFQAMRRLMRDLSRGRLGALGSLLGR
ncbi:signal recognition particle protein [Thermoleophilum album]|uniref:Signal recognition particle protein n=1 Tax=Thermoleophilum album TaxID=29539 RepID=A0A1H6FXK2_THEAL|nr:signal recognition particle protein [Thermoleophilum album]SEH15142.1 signal recognition particle subunit FFH/SRP54 (srp54) [Thermoleophilum album]